MKFPAVTVCNQNRVSCSKLKSAFKNCQDALAIVNSAAPCVFTSQDNDNTSVVVENAKDLWGKRSFCRLRFALINFYISEYACQQDNRSKRRRKRQTTGRFSREKRGPDPPNQEALGDLSDEYSIGFTRKFMYFTEENRKHFGHEYSKFIGSCSFKERNCLEER